MILTDAELDRWGRLFEALGLERHMTFERFLAAPRVIAAAIPGHRFIAPAVRTPLTTPPRARSALWRACRRRRPRVRHINRLPEESP